MKTKLFLFLALCFFLNNTIKAQVNIPIKDSTELQIFNKYIHTTISKSIDTSYSGIELNIYKIKYSTSCPYSEVLSLSEMQYTTYHYSTEDPLFRKINFQNNFYGCIENPIKYNDTTTYKFSQKSNINVIPNLIGQSIFSNVSEINKDDIRVYDKLNYIIIEHSRIFNHGGQNSSGVTFTYYLEKIN